MKSTSLRASAVTFAALLLSACGSNGYNGGGGGGTTGGTPGFYVVIRNMSFSPSQLAVPPGGTVTVLNQDAMPHSVTSETTEGAFTPGAVDGVQFDTGAFTGQRTFTMPANAVEGAVIPYYCTVHTSTMVTPNATIRVDSSAQPAPPPGSSNPGPMPGGY